MAKKKKDIPLAAMRMALRSVAEYDGGTNIMGEKLCPICNQPLADKTPENHLNHEEDCPMPLVFRVVEDF